ncbi:MAG: PTS fructose transporter subunit IIA [Myxococcales bacterium]|nr:PTS fructose transporter subunit IIA [Myxococcales bacterium]
MTRRRPTGVVLVTHGPAGEQMLAAAEKVVGHIEAIATVAVAAGEAASAVEHRIEGAVRALGSEGVVFLVDLGGSTPSNLCGRAAVGRSAVVSGMNLPMLFKLATIDRSLSPALLADELAATGQKSIQVRSC